MFRVFVALIMVLLWPRDVAARQVVINEFMASNASTLAESDFGEFADWVELHNAGAAPVDLAGWTLTDNLARPAKWSFPAGTTIGSGQFLLVWADSRATGLHTSFSLDREGEAIGLFDASGAPRDTLAYGTQATDVSMGRDPASPTAFVFFPTPTPGRANGPGVAGLLAAPSIDPPAGLHASAPTVRLDSPDGAVLRYTVDGSEPTPTSAVYAAPIPLTGTTVVRARAFREGWQASPTTTASYLVNEFPTLPVISLSTDPANFFDDRIGIYVVGTNGIPGYCRTTPHNWNQDWERPIHVEFFETDGSLAFAQDAGVKIFGGCTRIYAQKSLALYARSEYGPSRFEYKVFADVDLESFNNLVLRSSAQDWWRTMFRDGLIQTLIRAGMAIETQAYRPSLVFLNGQYWGIHNIREKLNEHYFADHFDLPLDGLEIVQNDKDPIEGSSAHFDRILVYLRSTDMTRPESLDPVADWIDLDAYVDYVTAEIYSANADWPGNNLKLWRPLTETGKWRWVIYDMDMGFGGNAASLTSSNTLVHATTPNGTLWSNPPWSTFVLRTMLTNPRFRNRFVQRFAAHMNTTFEPAHVNRVIDSLRANIAAEIPRHKQRWPQSISFSPTWDDAIAIVREFARNRASHVRGHFNTYFGLPGSAALHLDVTPPGSGEVLTAGVPMPTPNAIFFQAVPLDLEAVPRPGYHFVGWQGASTSNERATTVTLTGETTITAVFAPGTTSIDVPAESDLALDPAYPNPFESVTRLGFRLDRPGPATLRVFDVLGREMARPVDSWFATGRHEVSIDGASWPPGVYWVRFDAGGVLLTRRVTLVR